MDKLETLGFAAMVNAIRKAEMTSLDDHELAAAVWAASKVRKFYRDRQHALSLREIPF
jgi:hypothetical protein